MTQDLADPKDVAACLNTVHTALGQLNALREGLKQRASVLAAQAEDVTGRLRAAGVDTPEEIERIYASLSDDVKAQAGAAMLAEHAPPTATLPGPSKALRSGRRMV